MRMTDLPWERNSIAVGDMFGSLDDDPILRLEREAQYNRANAEEELKARTAPGPQSGLRPWENPASVEQEVFSRWGLQPPGQFRFGHGFNDIVKSGSTVLQRTPDGGVRPLYEPPDDTVQKVELKKLDDLRRQKMALIARRPNLNSQIPAWEAAIKAIEDAENEIFNKYVTQPGARSQPPASTPSGFMGAPGSNNAFTSNPFEQGLRMGGFSGSTNAPASSKYRIRLKQ